MNFRQIFLIISMVFISLLVIGAVSASEEISDAIEISDGEYVNTIENDFNQDTDNLLANDYEDNEEVLSEEVLGTADEVDDEVLSVEDSDTVEDVNNDVVGVGDSDANVPIVDAADNEAPLAENTNADPILSASKTSKIDIRVDGKYVTSFNFTHGENGFNFAEMMGILNMSKVNLADFGNFAQMFTMFNKYNFTEADDKTFDFKIDGEVGKIKYKLAVLSNATDLKFDYSINYPNQKNTAVRGKVISIYADGAFVKNLTLITKGASNFDFANMLNMAGMANIDMSKMMSMFNVGDSSKNFDFKIDGKVGVVKYNLVMIQNDQGFVFDYKINYPVVKVVLTAKKLTTTAFNYKIDGKIGKYLSVSLKDVWGQVLASKVVKISLNGKVYKVKTNSKGIAKLRINLSKSGTYYATICYLGDEIHPAAMKVVKIVVKKQKAKLTTYKKSYKAKSKSKKLKAKFLTAKGKAIKGKKITFVVKGKKYTAKTNRKGIATVKVKITKKGTYKFYAKFAGDATYKKVSKKSKLIIK